MSYANKRYVNPNFVNNSAPAVNATNMNDMANAIADIQDAHYGVCSTSASSAAKVVTISNVGTLVNGTTVLVKFNNGNTASSPSLNVSGTGAKSIAKNGSVVGSLNIPSGTTAAFCYDSTNTVWNLTGYAEGLPIAAGTGTGAVIVGNLSGQYANTASGNYAIAAGSGATASGAGAFAMGTSTASGTAAFAAGSGVTASGINAYAQNCDTEASGWYSSAAGLGTKAATEGQFVFGEYNTADATYPGSGNKGNYIEIVGNGTSNNARSNARTLDWSGNEKIGGMLCVGGGSYFQIGAGTGQYSLVENFTGTNTATGTYSHAEGGITHATGDASHAEGLSNTAGGNFSHAEGSLNTASGIASHVEGNGNTAAGEDSHCEGSSSDATGDYSHAEGYFNEVTGVATASHAEGYCCTVMGEYSHAEGNTSVARGSCSHAEGASTYANGYASHSTGYSTSANYRCQCVSGEWNKLDSTGVGDSTSRGTYIEIVGNGTASNARSNARTLDWSGNEKVAGTYSSGGADYAEMFEWDDGNHENEDRRGRFVTLNGDKIALADGNSDYILGIVSGKPTVIGDAYDSQWKGMYLTDAFGDAIWEEITVPAHTREITKQNGERETITISPEHNERVMKLNPAFDAELPYQPRSERPEWCAVGMLGKLVVCDDGTAKVNGYVKPAAYGVATAAAERTIWRVMARKDENHVLVMAR